MTDEYYQSIMERGGGMITCGGHLGVMIAPPENVDACPRGWVFVPYHLATKENVELAIQSASRSKWPKNQKKKAKSEEELLDQLFSSQDYIGS